MTESLARTEKRKIKTAPHKTWREEINSNVCTERGSHGLGGGGNTQYKHKISAYFQLLATKEEGGRGRGEFIGYALDSRGESQQMKEISDRSEINRQHPNLRE